MRCGSVSRNGLLFFLLTLVWPAAANDPQVLALLDNRFRIDHAVEQVTLLVRRENGSAPVVVVQPNGSKWYINRHPESVRWSATDSSDMILVDNPTPGPWQLIGAVDQGSEIRLMSDVKLHHEPFPSKLFRGQRLKLTAEIAGDSERIEMRDFYAQLAWKVQLRSANRAGDENFASGPYDIGTYYDDGSGLDERPHDGIFTANLDFDYPTGLYELQMTVENPVFSRQSRQPILVVPQPLRLRVDGSLESGYQLHVSIEPEILPQQVHLALTVHTPEQQRIDLPLQPTQLEQSWALPMLSELGGYSISGQVAGTTGGREEFFLELPQLHLFVAPAAPEPLSHEAMTDLAFEQAEVDEQQARERVLWVVGGINLALLVLGGVGLGLWLRRQRQHQARQAQPEPEAELTPEEVDLSALVSDLAPETKQS
ncbi:TIGR03503 family protein [Ferrimonas marina]|uniref:TIGR03503 family protein n=1 Tax=Ferrimonas marina TaxID=299255 RepID=A0A1M5Z441_9GAMM|nr:TIGR03503 family protein [Ferrimonas marina]SHI18979.1 TIGR03503 family protein [Ferrimonas marina]